MFDNDDRIVDGGGNKNNVEARLFIALISM
jgi:hypothetical protein